MDDLIAEFAKWQRDNAAAVEKIGFDMGADELLLIDGLMQARILTQAQRAWLIDFSARWDRQQGIEDQNPILVLA